MLELNYNDTYKLSDNIFLQKISELEKYWVFNIDTGEWTIEDKAMRCVSDWRMSENYTWNDLISDLGGTGAAWSAAGTQTWAYYLTTRQRLVYANTDGKLYYQSSENLDAADIDAYRIEPILDFGLPYNYKLLKEMYGKTLSAGEWGQTVKDVRDAWLHLGGSSENKKDPVSWTEKDFKQIINENREENMLRV